MAGLVPAVYVLLRRQDVDARDIGERSDAVLRTAMRGHDEMAELFRSLPVLAPAVRGRVVRAFRLDPILAVRAFHLLPERRAGLEIIHQELGGRERRLAVR